jgi:segregation and condensation protein A
MAEKAIPWWRKALQIALSGLRSGFGLFPRSARPEPFSETMISGSIRENREEERALTELSTKIAAAPMIPDGPLPAAELVRATEKGRNASKKAEKPVSVVEEAAKTEIAQEAVPERIEAAEAKLEAEPEVEPETAETPEAEAVNEVAEEPVEEPEPVIHAEPEAAAEPVPAPEVELVAQAEPEAAAEPVSAPEVELVAQAEPVVEPETAEAPEAESVNEVAEEPVEEPEPVIHAEPEAAAEPVPAPDIEPVTQAEPEPVSDPTMEPVAQAEPEPVSDPTMEPVAQAEPEPLPAPAMESVTQAAEPPLEAETPAVAEPEPIPEPVTVPVPDANAVPQRALKPQPSAEEKEAARLAARQKKLDEGSEESPFSVIVGQVYDGPIDLLLDLIRKQDINIYDIPIAIITSQFLAYVNQLKASDVDVAGDFIYTASLLIHIKSKMLLPHTETGPEAAAEDPRRELVERLLEHERFKNAAQMLQQKQMLEAATWSNPGMSEFKDDEAAEPEIAADTVDLVRVFREILERARNRPVIDVEEDSVTVGQMIQFLARRLTMEDRPVALRRLLSHTRSERALIAMFLALLEMVRLQAILLRQDRQFSDIFIKKHSGFDAVMNEGLGNARDDWR